MRIRIHSIHRHACAPDWSWDTGRTGLRDMDLWLVLGGNGVLKSEDRRFELVAGDLFLLRPRTRYIGNHDPERPLSVYAAHYDYMDDTDNILDAAAIDPPPLHRRAEDLPFLEALLQRCHEVFAAGDRRDADGWFSAFLREVDRQDRLVVDAPPRPRETALAELLEEIRQNPAAAPDVDAMAKRLHCTRRHATRLFRQSVGRPPREFILQCRIESARALLLHSSHSIGRIAEILGYRDVFFFSRQFRHKVGVSPTAYRRGGH